MNYFKDLELFSCIPEMEQRNLSDFCQLQNISKGDVLFQEWDDPQAMYIIVSGEIGVYKKNNEWVFGQIANLWVWDMVGEMAFFWEPPKRNASVIALDDSSFIVMLDFSMQELLEKYPQIHKQVRSVIEQRIEENNKIDKK